MACRELPVVPLILNVLVPIQPTSASPRFALMLLARLQTNKVRVSPIVPLVIVILLVCVVLTFVFNEEALLVTQAMCSGAGVPIAIPSGTAASSASSSAASSSAAATVTSPSAASSIPTTAAAGNATTVVPSTSNNGTLASGSPTPTNNAASRLGAMSGVVALGLGIAAFAI